MPHFDSASTALEARIDPVKLDELTSLIRCEYPNDDMMAELQLLRTCIAVRDGLIRVDEILKEAHARHVAHPHCNCPASWQCDQA